MIRHIPFTMHLAILASGIVFVLVLAVVTGLVRFLMDHIFNTHHWWSLLFCYIVGFFIFYFYGILS